MGIYELNPSDYKLENIQVEMAQIAGTTFHLLDQNLKIATDDAEVAHILDTYLGSFFIEYDRVHRKGEELNPENLVVPIISHVREDLLSFKGDTQNIARLLEEANKQYTLPKYFEYSKKLKGILLEADRELIKLEREKDNGKEDGGAQKAA